MNVGLASIARALRRAAAMGVAWLSITRTDPASAAELVMWTADHQPERLVTMEYVANVFMALHDDLQVRIQGVDENELPKRLARAVAQGASPTLVNAGSEQLLSFGAEGLLDDGAATELVGEIGRERFYRGALGMLATETPGASYAVPLHGWVQGVWYRKDWFDEAGLAPPSDWEGLLTAAETLHDPTAGRYGIVVGTEDDVYAAQVFSQIALANDAGLFDERGQVVVTSARMREALDFHHRLTGYMPPGATGWRARDFFLQGRLAMLFYSTFVMDDLALASAAADSLTGEHFDQLDGAPFDVGLVDAVDFAPVITRRSLATYGSIGGIGVLAGLDPETRAQAQAFLRFLFQPDVYVTWLRMAPGGMMPVLRDIATSERFLRDPSGTFVRHGRDRVRKIIGGLETLRTFGRTDGRFHPAASQAFADGIVSRMVHRVATGEATAEEATGTAEAAIRRLLAGR